MTMIDEHKNIHCPIVIHARLHATVTAYKSVLIVKYIACHIY